MTLKFRAENDSSSSLLVLQRLGLNTRDYFALRLWQDDVIFFATNPSGTVTDRFTLPEMADMDELVRQEAHRILTE